MKGFLIARKLKGADYIATKKDMINYLVIVSQKELKKSIVMATELKNKVLNKKDTSHDWIKFNEQTALAEFYKSELINLFLSTTKPND